LEDEIGVFFLCPKVRPFFVGTAFNEQNAFVGCPLNIILRHNPPFEVSAIEDFSHFRRLRVYERCENADSEGNSDAFFH
jgi:hypothetical protein